MALTPGTTLGPYRIVSQLGSGGMGVVYTATDPRLDRQVAIKLLPPNLTRDETAKQRFLQEAKAASALDHPNICNIHEINERDDGQPNWPGGAFDPEKLIRGVSMATTVSGRKIAACGTEDLPTAGEPSARPSIDRETPETETLGPETDTPNQAITVSVMAVS